MALTLTTVCWQWSPEQQNAFQTMKKMMAWESILAYPDFTKPFEIHAHKLGACISQEG
jgi:hypothetical protein